MKKIISLILIVIIVCSTISGCFLDDIIKQTNSTSTTKKPIDYSQIEWEEKIYCNATVEDDFYPGHVLLLMDKAISEPNKDYEKEFFSVVEIEKIIDLTRRQDLWIPDEDFRQILLLILKEKTKEAVIDAINKLIQIDGVKSADPDYYVYYETIPNDPYYSSTSNGYGQ